MRVAIAHEWLVRYGGSERTVEQLLLEFAGATLLTTVLSGERLPESLRQADTSFLQGFGPARRSPEWFIPLMPLAWRLRSPVSGVDALISSNHACAKSVTRAPGIPHVCYCHTPMRYAWDFEPEAARFPSFIRPVVRASAPVLRRWDRATAANVDFFVANSSAVAERIQRYYDRSARVVHPPVRTDFFTPAGPKEDFFLHVGRLVSYKRPDLAVAAFTELPHRLVVVGDGHMRAQLERSSPPNVEFRGDVDDDELRALYRSARALLAPGVEDFGIVMAEALACGTPVVAAAAGGARDIVEPELDGWLIEPGRVEELRSAIRRAALEDVDPQDLRARAERFSAGRFRAEMREVVEEAVAQGNRRQRLARSC